MIGLLIKNILLYHVSLLYLCKYNLIAAKLLLNWREGVYHLISETSEREEKTLHSLKWAIGRVPKPLLMYHPLKKAYLLTLFYVL